MDYFFPISYGNHDVNLFGQNSINNGGRIDWMLRNTLPAINAQFDASLTQKQGAALQLAIWDVVHDGGDGFAAGRIRQSADALNSTDSIVLSLANSFLSASLGRTQTGGIVYVNVPGPTSMQRLMSDGIAEPSTYALMLTGCTLVALRAGKGAAPEPW